MPLPNERCCAAPVRVRSTVSASSPQWAGSRLAEPSTTKTNVPARDRAAVDVDIDGGDAARELHRRVVAQQLVDRGGRDRRVVLPPFELRAVAEQRERAVADEVDGGLVTGDEQQHDLVDELVGGEPLALVLGVDERGEQVVGGMRALPLDRFEDVVVHVVGRVHDVARCAAAPARARGRA